MALGGRRASVVAYYSWSLPAPRRLGDCLREARKKLCAVLRSWLCEGLSSSSPPEEGEEHL